MAQRRRIPCIQERLEHRKSWFHNLLLMFFGTVVKFLLTIVFLRLSVCFDLNKTASILLISLNDTYIYLRCYCIKYYIFALRIT